MNFGDPLQDSGEALEGIERVVSACLRTLVVAERADACQAVLRQVPSDFISKRL